MATDVRSVLIKLVGENNTKKAFVSLGKSLAKVKDFMLKIGKVGAVAMAGAFAITVKAINAASRYNEVLSKFDTVFKDQAETAKEWAVEFSRSVGISQRAALQFMAGMQDLFVPLGFARKEATEFSKQVVRLAVDLASFNNMKTADVIRDIQSALTGGGETMKKYGVIVSQAAVNQELLNMGISGGTKEATNQQKAQAALNIIMAGTTDAQGDAIRTASSWANTMKSTVAEIENISVAIGNELIPVLKPLLSNFRDIIRANRGIVSSGVGLWVAKITAEIKEFFRVGRFDLWVDRARAAIKGFNVIIQSAISWLKILKVVSGVGFIQDGFSKSIDNVAEGWKNAKESVESYIATANQVSGRQALVNQAMQSSGQFGFLDEDGNNITREQAIDRGLLEESKSRGKGIGAELRMAVKKNNDSLIDGIMQDLRSNNTQLAGATLAGGTGI